MIKASTQRQPRRRNDAFQIDRLIVYMKSYMRKEKKINSKRPGLRKNKKDNHIRLQPKMNQVLKVKTCGFTTLDALSTR